MKQFLTICLVLAFSSTLLAADSEQANQTSDDVFVVYLHDNSPCVILEDEESASGFELELFKLIAEKLELNLQYKEIANFSDLLTGVDSEEADIAIGGITIRADREVFGDFTHSTVPSRLAIMVNSEQKINYFQSAWDWWLNLAPTIVVMAVFIAVMAPLVWLCERRREGGEENPGIRSEFREGLPDAVDFAIVTSTSTGYGNRIAMTLGGRLLSYVLMFVGIALTGVVCSKVTTFELKQASESAISSPYDLNGRIVATVENSSSVDALRKYGALPFGVPDVEQAAELLRNGEVAAVVFDWPMLRHYVLNKGKGDFNIAVEFEDQDYGFLLQKNSKFREDINRELLELRRTGVYQELFNDYFL